MEVLTWKRNMQMLATEIIIENILLNFIVYLILFFILLNIKIRYSI